ncbi:MAG TPA: hypothetical protein PKD64_03955 [Pirellulaceae bacterium]|nr:hypothetical protein [Pirellulaceae bacterium]HMO91325.1 hypothetical protein [Pirellulaceae bacterium]HMP70144.1 hypothetical protein [Pirellulaceae bacterium]
MAIVDLLILLIVAAICGSLGQAIVGFSRGGCITAIVLGFIGAMLGFWLKNLAGLPEPLMLQVGGSNFPVLWSIIGSALFVAIITFLTGKRKV